MRERNGRLVKKVQLHLLGRGPAVMSEASLVSGIAELEDRVAKLRRLGAQYADVRLSEEVSRLRGLTVAEC